MKFDQMKGVSATLEHIKEALSHNKLKKFIALIMSMSLWVYVMGAQNPVIEDNYRVKVRLKSTMPNYKAFFDEQDVRITLSAPRSYFIDYNDSDIRAYIDITNYGEGEYDLPIDASYPKGFELIRISPETVHVKIEPIIDRQMDLDITLSGSPNEDVVVKNIDAPKNVAVVGAKSSVEKVTKVIGYVGIVGQEDDFELNVPVTAVDENGREVPSVRVVPSTVNVFADVEKGAKKIVPIVADVTAPNGKEISKITVNPEIIEIQGTKDVIDSLDSIKTVNVMIPDGKDTYKNYLNVVVPEGVLKTGIERVFVTVELKTASTQ